MLMVVDGCVYHVALPLNVAIREGRTESFPRLGAVLVSLSRPRNLSGEPITGINWRRVPN